MCKELSDADTVAYFDENVPEYDASRLEFAAAFVRKHGSERASLIDIGCGAGNTLMYLSSETSVRRFTALDVSPNCLETTRARIECDTVLGSVLDDSVSARLSGCFDFGVLAAVLHHLVGKTRRESRQNAITAIRYALGMVDKTGYLIIHEPTLAPRAAMYTVFHLKRGISRLSGNRRVPVLGYWGNLGAPVVSYYSPGELRTMVERAGGRVVDEHVQAHPERGSLGPVMQLLNRSDTTLVATRAAA